MNRGTLKFFLFATFLGIAIFTIAFSSADAVSENVNASSSVPTPPILTLKSSEKRLGRNKKKIDGKVYASYGLSNHKAHPSRVVPYSDHAVKSASSAHKMNKKRASSAQKTASRAKVPRGRGGLQAKVDLRPYMSEVENQAHSNSCAANAVAGAYEYLAERAALRKEEDDGGDISRLFIYYVGRKHDQKVWNEDVSLKPKDEGMSLSSAIDAVQLKGASLQSSWPFDLRKVNERPTEAAFDEALRYKVGDAMHIPLKLDKMRNCLSDGYPIIFGLKLTQAFFAPPYDGFIPTPDSSDRQSAEHGLHAMLIVGYNDRQRVFIVRNSWGTGWGVDGYCFLSYDYVANKAFNFLGMYAIQSLHDDDLTPNEDDGEDHEQTDIKNKHHGYSIDHHVDHSGPDEVEHQDDAEDMFCSKAEARRAFLKIAGDNKSMSADNLQLSKEELHMALAHMGISMVTDEEIDMAFARYDDDKSGFINYEEFLDMQDLFDGSLINRKRTVNKMKKSIKSWFRKIERKFISSSSPLPQEL